MRTHGQTLGLLAAILVAAIGWFIWRSASNPAPVVASVPEEARASSLSGTHAAGIGVSRVANSSLFLATHEQGEAFTPTGDNLAPSFHVEVEALNRRLEAAPQDTTTLLRLARLKQDGHQTEEAVAYYRQYLALHPEGRQAWLDLMQCLGDLEQWAEALEAAQSLLRYYPDDPGGLYNLGAIYANTNRFEEARTVWQQVAKQDRHAELKMMAASALQRLASMHP